MKQLLSSLGILSVFLPLTAQALVLPDAERQLPGHYQNVGNNSVLPRSSSSSAITMNVERDAALNIRFSYPNNWDILDSVTFLALWPHDDGMSAKTDDSAIRIDVESLHMPEYTDAQLDNYFKNLVTIDNQASPLNDYYVPSFNLIGMSGATLLGHAARVYTYTGELHSVKSKMVLVLATINQKLYSIYYHSSLDTFDADYPVFEQVFSSFASLKSDTSSSSTSSVVQAQSSAASAHALFSDVDVSTPTGQAINALAARGVLSGYSDSTFRPTATVNRAELLKILIAGLHKGEMKNEDNCFPDFSHQWFSQYVCAAKRLKWVGGYPDGTFRPANTVTQAEAIKMIVSSLPASAASSAGSLPAGVDASAWYAPYVGKAAALGILTGTTFDAGADLTRGMAALWIESAVEATGE